jgi:unsaturated rhamnogalacturonyl hydrolase
MKRMKLFTILYMVNILLMNTFSNSTNTIFGDLPNNAQPVKVGIAITKRFLEQPHSQYGSPLRADEPRTQITYPDVCVWLGGLWFAKETKNYDLQKDLITKFMPLLSTESFLQPKPNHVDNNVFGALALEISIENGNEEIKKMGMMYADSQWELPANWTLVNQAPLKSSIYGTVEDADINQKQQLDWSLKGYTWQTRFWLDDMFMITTLQAQAYRSTQNPKYIDRAAREMILYLDSIQKPSGLFYHSPSAPYYWARGNGWMAVGLTEVLRLLPDNSSYHQKIMESYLKMMSKLKSSQTTNGMWPQLIDDPTMWEETSGTAMFTYAMIVGVKNGWLPKSDYTDCAKKGWIALCTQIEKNGDVKNVCEGTNIGDNKEHYRNRKAVTGDLHGQAPVLWCAYALTASKL